MIFKFTFVFLLGCFANSSHDRRLAGGLGTSNDLSKQAFNHPLSTATKAQKRSFGVGNSFFKQAWVEFPSSTIGRDGLGPLFNAVSCSSCHNNDGRGPGFKNDKVHFSTLFRISIFDKKEHPIYGGQIQPVGTNGVTGEGKVQVSFELIKGIYPDGESYELRKPKFNFDSLNYGTLEGDVSASPRAAPQLVGLGLLEAILDDDILAYKPDDVSGEVNWVQDIEDASLKIGRFGWKAEQPNLKQQNAAAFVGDMGLTSELFKNQNCSKVQTECNDAPRDSELEVSKKVLDRVTTYTQLIAVPKARDVGSKSFKLGASLFEKARCTSCHRPSYTTGTSHPIEALRGQKIWPYTDLKVHDMGEALADRRLNGEVSSSKWRTPPLWSTGLIKVVNNHTNFLHDGRARSLEEAILWHGGEAEVSKQIFMNFNKSERKLLVHFIKSI